MPSGSSTGSPDRDQDTIQQRGVPSRCLREAVGLLRDARFAGLGPVVLEDGRLYSCPDCSMTFGRETVLLGHMRSHKRDHMSSEFEEDVATPKRARRKSKRKLAPVKTEPHDDEIPTWGTTARRGRSPVSATCVIVIDSDNDDGTNSINTVTRSRRSPDPASDAAPAPVVAVMTTMSAPHATPSTTIEGAPAAAPPALAPVVAATTTTTHLATTVSVTTPIVPGSVKENSFGEAGACYRNGLYGKAVASNNNNSFAKALAGNSSDGYGTKGVAGCTSQGYGNDLAVCSNGSNSRPTATGGESKKGFGKGHNCAKCDRTFHSAQALGGHLTAHRKIEKSKAKLGFQRAKAYQKGPHKSVAGNASSSSAPRPGIAAAAKEMTSTGINKTSAAVDGHTNTRSYILGLPVQNPVHQLPRGMAMAGNPATGHSPAAINATGRSLPATTRSVLPAISLHNQEENPLEQIAVAPGERRNINHALSSEEQEENPLEEIAIVPGNASFTPRPGVDAVTEPSEAIGINSNVAATDVPVNNMGHRWPFLASRSSTFALPVSRPVNQPTQWMAPMLGNPMSGHFPASITSTGWSLPPTTRSILPAIPSHNQEVNPLEEMAVPPGNHGRHNINPALSSDKQEENPPEEIAVMPGNASSSSTPYPGVPAATEPYKAIGINSNVAAIDAPANTMRWWPFPTGSSSILALPVSRLVNQTTQRMAMAGNSVTGHFPAAIAATGWSLPATSSSVIPAIPLQNQEENPPEGIVVPGNGERCSTRLFGFNIFPTLPSQNQAENPQEEIVPGNNGGRTVRVSGVNFAEGQKEPNK